MNCEMTGLLGGTFDPPHYGHLILAMEAFFRFDLDRVLLVPSRFPPHKTGRTVTPFLHRFRMTELATEGAPELAASDLEPPEGPSWTVNLLQKLKGEGLEICFIMGMDSLRELHTWKDPGGISRMARMVAGTRPGFDGDPVSQEFRNMVETFSIPAVDISSSQLRNRFAEGLNTRYLLPETVRDYIRENDLYA
ncbi:MAG: nicotinate (nicotinamide) nucleotide adenylyltransferase [Candidatus Fermentibacteraceae bacterium]|nr:nicotinate (nicotinamide) nucleotide adenylyltransferase [Candidatus Fermentibacteraceae bacterium]